MKLQQVVRIGVRVLASLVGVLLTLVVLAIGGPTGCGRVNVRGVGEPAALAPADTIRASALQRFFNRPAALVVAARSEAFQAMQVQRLLDADTYEAQPMGGGSLVRLRLLGVDAPEHDQPFGRQAVDSVGRVLLGRYVLVRVAGVDRYGRNLAVVRLRAGAFRWPRTVALDSLLVARGWAWAYAPAGEVVLWAGQEQAARAAGRGLWKCGTAGVVRPGIWRAYNRQEKATAGWGCPW